MTVPMSVRAHQLMDLAESKGYRLKLNPSSSPRSGTYRLYHAAGGCLDKGLTLDQAAERLGQL